jgi:hypothetical protein
MSPTTPQVSPELATLFERVRERLDASDRFDSAGVEGPCVVAHATDAPEEVRYRIEFDGSALWAAWVSEDRYISQSIEAEIMWTGDDLDDMIDEESVDAGWSLGRLEPMEHFRNEEMLFTFRSKLPIAPSKANAEKHAEQMVAVLTGYAEAFAELGDMKPDDDDD